MGQRGQSVLERIARGEVKSRLVPTPRAARRLRDAVLHAAMEAEAEMELLQEGIDSPGEIAERVAALRPLLGEQWVARHRKAARAYRASVRHLVRLDAALRKAARPMLQRCVANLHRVVEKLERQYPEMPPPSRERLAGYKTARDLAGGSRGRRAGTGHLSRRGKGG